MFKILFVCHGNICRSPMAEFIMKDLVKKAGLSSEFYIESAATSAEELGNPVYPPARQKLHDHGISCKGKTARRMEKGDYDKFDMLIAMERYNFSGMSRICGGDPAGKFSLLLDHTEKPGDVSDPWYSRDFETAWNDIERGCRGLLKELTQV